MLGALNDGVSPLSATSPLEPRGAIRYYRAYWGLFSPPFSLKNTIFFAKKQGETIFFVLHKGWEHITYELFACGGWSCGKGN